MPARAIQKDDTRQKGGNDERSNTTVESSQVGRRGRGHVSWFGQPKVQLFRTQGPQATHYEDMTVDVQPDPERYLLQDWIISFPDGTPTYSKSRTKALSSNWHQFRAVDQEWERTHYQRQSTICGMVQGVIENARKSGAPKRFDKAWVGILQNRSGRLEACRVWSWHVVDASAALRLHPDD